MVQEVARGHEDTLPLGAAAVLKSTYMDDTMDSTRTVGEGRQLYEQLTEL